MDEANDQGRNVGENTIARRSMLLWGGAIAASAMVPGLRAEATTAAGGAVPVGVPAKMDAKGVELYMRLHASSEDAEVPWYYTGRIYAIRERQAPVHLFNLEGTEIYWVRRVSASEWTVQGSTLTFYRDVQTGEYLDSYKNPLTNRTLPVNPNVLRAGAGVYSTFSEKGAGNSRGNLIPWMCETHVSEGVFWLVNSRYSLNMPQPWLEVQSIFASESDVANPRITNPAATFTSAYSAPYLAWMDMGDEPGHLLWHSSGRKLSSLAEVPQSYRARAERLQPIHFTKP